MRRHILIVLGIVLLACHGLGAQNASCHFGVYGGFTTNNFSSLKSAYGELKDKTLMGWNAGVNLHIKLPAYFSISPGVEYGRVNLDVTNTDLQFEGQNITRVKQHLVTVPVPIAWGPDLGVIRPFVQVVPFVNFNVGGRFKTCDGDLQEMWREAKDMFAMAQFGLGAGGGIELWKFIITARYNWMFGSWNDVRQAASNPFADFKGRRRGVTVTLGFNF